MLKRAITVIGFVSLSGCAAYHLTGCASYNFDEVIIETTVIGKGCKVERGEGLQGEGSGEAGVSIPGQEGTGAGRGAINKVFTSNANCNWEGMESEGKDGA